MIRNAQTAVRNFAAPGKSSGENTLSPGSKISQVMALPDGFSLNKNWAGKRPLQEWCAYH
jgi:hypothetical protein